MSDNEEGSSRRTFLTTGAAAVALTATGALATTLPANSAPLEITPTCVDDDDTPSGIEGPYFKRNSPERTNLRTSGVTGVLLSLTGFVYTERCAPVSHALLDFWQADDKGAYDNTGVTYKLRGHQYTNAQGAFVLETVVPKDYPGRTPHIHVKVQAANGPILTTQLYFPDNLVAYGMNVAALNRRDAYINRKCTVKLGALVANRYPATFDFVIET
jgi:protocatechuate 3,4-dioxygenase beta subunit